MSQSLAPLPTELLSHLMAEALCLAEAAFAKGEVPIGAVVAKGADIIGRGFNRVEETKDPTAHAEILAIRDACKSLDNWCLSDLTLCVTLEPCTMCVGAMKLARMGNLVYGAGDSRFGAVSTVYDLVKEPRTGPVPGLYTGVRAEECLKLLQGFFEKRRGR